MTDMPIVAEIEHSTNGLEYAKNILDRLLISRLNQIKTPSIGVEISPEAVEIAFKMEEKHLSPGLSFWKEIIKICRNHGIKIIPLVDFRVTKYVDDLTAACNKVISELYQSKKISNEDMKKKTILIGNQPVVVPWLFFDKMSRNQLDFLTVKAGKMILESDRQLKENIQKETPTLSFLGWAHGEPLKDIAHVIKFPDEHKHEYGIKEIEFYNYCRKHLEDANARILSRIRQKQMPKRKKKTKKRRK